MAHDTALPGTIPSQEQFPTSQGGGSADVFWGPLAGRDQGAERLQAEAVLSTVRPEIARVMRHIVHHQQYLGDVRSDMMRSLRTPDGKKAGLHWDPYNGSDNARLHVVIAKDGMPDSPLDLTLLGLPKLHEADDNHGLVPVAVLAHRSDRQDMTSAIEVLAWDSGARRIVSRFLENPAAAIHGIAGDATARWVDPSELTLSNHALNLRYEYVKGNSRGKGGIISVQAMGDGTTFAFRSRLSPREAKAESSLRYQRSRIKGVAKVLLPALGAFLVLPTAARVAQDRVAKFPTVAEQWQTADDIIGDPSVKVRDGVEQAEQFYDNETLSWAHEAFRLYLAGDTMGLLDLIQKSGYEYSLANTTGFEDIAAAQSIAETEQAFNAAMAAAGAPITFRVANDADVNNHEFEQTITTTDDLEGVREMATSALNFWLGMDGRYMRTMHPLDYVVGKSLSSGEGANAGLYCTSGKVGVPDTIFMIVGAANRLPHEDGHYMAGNPVNGNHMEVIMGKLNAGLDPYDMPFLYRMFDNDPAWVNSSPDSMGRRQTVDSYSNKTDDEDYANVFESITSNEGTLWLENSPLSEKQIAAILQAESQMRGFTAVLLTRMPHIGTPDGNAYEQPSAFDRAMWSVLNNPRVADAIKEMDSRVALVPTLDLMISSVVYLAYVYGARRRMSRGWKRPRRRLEPAVGRHAVTTGE